MIHFSCEDKTIDDFFVGCVSISQVSPNSWVKTTSMLWLHWLLIFKKYCICCWIYRMSKKGGYENNLFLFRKGNHESTWLTIRCYSPLLGYARLNIILGKINFFCSFSLKSYCSYYHPNMVLYLIIRCASYQFFVKSLIKFYS